jgi:hypothetical protein
VIRFSAALVVVAVGVLVAGIATSKLALVYVAIGLSAVALVALAIGVLLKRDELFGDAEQQVGLATGAAAGQSALVGGPAFGHGDTVSGAYGAGAYGSDQYGADPYGRQAGQGRVPVGATGSGSSAGGNAPAAPRRADLSQTRTDLAQTRADMSALREQPRPAGLGQPDLSKTRTDLTPPPASAPPSPAPSAPPAATAPAPSDAPAAGKPPTPPWQPPSGASWFDRQREAEEAAAAKSASASGVGKNEAEHGADADSAPAADVPPDSSDEAAATAENELDAKSEAKNADDAVAGEHVDESTTDGSAAPDDSIKEVAGARTAVIDTTLVNAASAGTDRPDAATDAPAETDAAAGTDADGPPANAGGSVRSGEHQVTVVPGVPRYHAANCILIRFMDEDDLQKMTLDEATKTGCSACRACQADTGAFEATD